MLKKILPLFIITLGFLLNIQPSFSAQKAKSVFIAPQNKEDTIALKEIKNAGTVQDVINFLNKDMILPRTITIIVGAEDGPLYDPETIQIEIPYSFITEMKEFFSKDYKINDEQITPKQAAQDVLLHTLFHEIGHALIDILNLPTTGKEEDAVDNLATLLLIEFYENGSDIALSAAEAFAYENETIDEFEDQDFWDEHSLDIQRYYSTLCLIYGGDPENYKDIISELGEERSELCIEDYDKKAESWFTLLKPHLKETKANNIDKPQS